MMDKSMFNARLADMCRYSMLDKTEIQAEKNRFPYCSLLQMMDILSDKATDTSRWEERFLPKAMLYLIDNARFEDYLRKAEYGEFQVPVAPKPVAETEKPKAKPSPAAEQDAFDIMKEINAYQEVSFKTAPKSVILSKFLESGNYNPDEMEDKEDVPVEVLGKKSIAKDESLETETLAVVLEKQGRWERAIDVYEKLIVKYPEKSSIFAVRISELKLKLENNKK